MSLATIQFARNILRNLRETYSGEPHTRLSAEEKDFPHLDLAAYARFRDTLESRDFRFLGDYEIADVSRARGSPMTRTFIRYMISADGTMVSSYYQVRQRTGKRLRMLFNELMDGRGKAAWEDFKQAVANRPCMDIGTDFSDGRSVSTSNAGAAGKLADPPAMETLILPAETGIEALLQAHAARIAEVRAQHPDAQPVAIATTEELFQLQDRVAMQKADYRRSLNWITRDELLAMSGGNEAFAGAVYEEIQKQLAEEVVANEESKRE
ncbi:MAG TPA: hypothetical protein VKC56_07180 [Gallionellaceae bacterium]|nr:hypothetical protein [Gallionellaceae bacterium]